MSFAIGGAIIGGSLITASGNKSAAKIAAGATPKFATELQPLVTQTAGNLEAPKFDAEGNQISPGGIAGQPIQQFQGDRVADFTGFQQQGLSQTPGLSQALQQQAGTAAGGFQTFAGGSQVGQNPFLDQAIQAMQQSANQNLQRNQLPGIRNTAVAAGGLGGSRQGIAEGLAISDLNQTLVNQEAGLRSGQFNQDQQNQLQALINQGNILGGQGASQQALLQSGALQQQQAQAEIGGAQQLFDEQQNQEFNRQQQLLQILTGAPASVPQIPNQANPLVAGLGAGLATSQLFGGGATNNFIPGSSSTFLPPGTSPTFGGGSPLVSPF